MFDYIVTAFVTTASEGLLLFGGVFALAVALWFVSQNIRSYGAGLLGNGYYYLVAPGVACHETGHALGCILTGTKIVKYVPFRPEGERLGYVLHEIRPGIWPQIARFFIATGPVWFGCAMIMLLSRLLAGPGFLPSFDALAPYPGEPFSAHVKGVWHGALLMFQTIFAPSRWHSWLFPLFLYLVFCIASEITLSPTDLNGMWRGLAAIVGVLLALNLIPFTAVWLAHGIDFLRPGVFALQTILFFVLLTDIAFLAAIRLLWTLFARRR